MGHLVRADPMFRPLLIAVMLALWAPGASGQAQGVLRVRITLTDGSTARIDSVVIQVCRVPLYSTWTPVYCGRPQTYTP